MQQIAIFTKIITSGQTGADQGALDAALRLGHPCGGWCPKGRKSEAGRIPDRYPLQEHPSASYPARTEANVHDADGTLVFLHGQPTRGTALTLKLARKHAKPLFIVDLEQVAVHAAAERIWEWGLENRIKVLNVAGSRESKHPGISGIVQAVIERVIGLARDCAGHCNGTAMMPGMKVLARGPKQINPGSPLRPGTDANRETRTCR